MAKVEIMDLITICQSFPRITGPQIPRDNFLDAVDTIFEGETELIVIEGPEGIGKTTLLAQFVTRHPDHALSLFVKSTSRWAYNPGILRFDLCNQLQWALYKEELAATECADDTFLRTHLFELQKRARRNRETFYFVVDGLDEIPKEDSQIRGLILDMLPLGLSGFRFLLAGDFNQLSANIPGRAPLSKPFPLSSFILDETVRYLKGLNIDQQSIEEIHQICRGIPGYLASVRRILLQSDVDVWTLLGEMPNKLPGLFEIEWCKVKSDDDRQLKLLAILAHDRKRHRIDDLARILGVETATIPELLQDLGFVTIDPQSCEVSFVSEAFREFAVNQLRHLKEEVNDLLISDLFRSPDSEASLSYLPVYLQQAGRSEDLLDYLSPDHFAKMLELSQSLSPVRQKADLGLNTALKLRRDGDLMRFSLQQSAMAELGGAEVWRSEIEARMALDDYDSALALAQSTILREERLHLLAVIARTKREQGLSPEPELMEQIRQLYDQIAPTALGERAIEIASDLIYSNFDLAVDLVEKATSTDMDENALDWAFAKLSIAALVGNREQPQPVEAIESIRARIKDPKARRFSAAASLLLGESSAAEVIAQAKKLESASDRLLLLRQWAMDNRERGDAAKVVDFALELAIKTTEYAPNARVLREIATPLPFIQDERKARKLVGSFDSQKVAIERLGPTEDYIRLQLLLAQAESKYNFEAARNRLVDIYFYISNLDDLAIKTSCMARLTASLPDMDPKMILETKEGMHTIAREDLKSSVEQLLSGTAEHYHATRGIIRALAKTMPDMALELAMTLNTEERRDLALLELVESATQMLVSKLDLAFVGKVIDQFADLDWRDEALLKVVERLSLESEDLGPSVTEALSLINRIGDIQDVGERCRACCLAHKLLTKHNTDKYSGLASHLLHQLDAAWQSIDSGWHKVDIGFRITDSLAAHSLETARRYLDLTDQFRDEVLLDTHAAAWTYITCLRLAIRAYSGLWPNDLATKEDMESLTSLIDQIPSSGKRAELWAELALRFYVNERLSDCKRIVTEHVKPLLQNITDDPRYRTQVMIKTSPALYCAHKLTALELISELPLPQRDAAYVEICEFILRKKPTSDPYEVLPRQGYDITYEEIVDICELLDQMDHDAAIHHFVECISDSMVRRRDHFSRQQQPDVADRLERVINSKLPNPRHIRHEGYRIAAQAQVARIRRSGSQVWIDLIDSARNITNLADRALVLGMIAVSMPNREAARRKQILREAKELVEQIPATLDRIERYEELASMVLDIDSAMARECLRLAMKSAVKSETPELYSVQRRVIDNAYRLDPDLAASLASLADDDPARERVRANLKRRIQILDLKKKMVSQLKSGVDSASPSRSNYPQAAWMLLGSLNAGRVAAVPFDQVRDIAQIAASLPLSQSYPMLAWTIENAVVKYARTEQARTWLRPIYDATLLGVELAARMTAHSSVQLERAKRRAHRTPETKSILIRSGDREGAIQFLKDWFASEVRDYLKICDPYFGPDDLKVLQILCSVNPACKVQILTSKKHQDNEGIPAPWGETYRTHWHVRVSDQDPPETDIVIAGTESGGELPIHDRWWLTLGGGIRIGTSFNALGLSKTSEISFLSQEEAEMFEKEVDQYLQRAKREHDGERVLYDLITL